MPPEVPEVHVTSDPLLVFTFVALFGTVLIVTVLFAAISSRRSSSPAVAGDSLPPWSTAAPDTTQWPRPTTHGRD